MNNVKISVKGSVVTIVLDVAVSLGASKSGKTEMVATTHGNITIPGTDVKLGLNAYRPAKAA
jgi:hypothetical protein